MEGFVILKGFNISETVSRFATKHVFNSRVNNQVTITEVATKEKQYLIRQFR
jgi:hypothetical protein